MQKDQSSQLDFQQAVDDYHKEEKAVCCLVLPLNCAPTTRKKGWKAVQF